LITIGAQSSWNRNTSAAREVSWTFTDAELIEEARDVWESWPSGIQETNSHSTCLPLQRGEDAPERCADEYIRQEFNAAFAASFDRQLSRSSPSPALIGKALDAITDPLEALDVLIGRLDPVVRILRPMATHLVGADLAPAMLDEAKKRDRYDELVESEMEFMESNLNSFDLIIFVRHLVLLRDSGRRHRRSRCLKKKTAFWFTVENDKSGPGPIRNYRLQSHGRSPPKHYVRSSMVGAGFTVGRSGQIAIQRNEGVRPVEGLVVTATLN
jgi:predicted TPR repeat methyltransferase